MSNLKAYHIFLGILKEYLQLPPPKPPLGEYLIANPFSSEEKDIPARFSVSDDHGLFLARLQIKDKGWLAGLVTHLEVTLRSLKITLFGSSFITKKVPLSQLLDLEVHSPPNKQELFSLIVQQMNQAKENSEPERDRHGRHLTATTDSPAIQW